MILSLQGCMAVGKTTAARYLQAHDPQLHVCFEDNAAVIAEVKRRGLDKNCYADYLEVQRLFLQNEVRRWQEAQKYPCTVMDFGAEEIVFYTLHYPKSKGLDWGVEELRRALAPELAAAQGCMPEHILFLDASDETLRTRKEGDTARTRRFFEHYRNQLLPLKREWFRNREDTTFLQTDGLTAEQEGKVVLRWCTQWIGMNR